MPNPNYIKGRRKEQNIVRRAKEEGHIAFRSAGSHSPIDVCIIDEKERVIRFIQSKPDSFSQSKKEALLLAHNGLNGAFQARFEVI